MAAINMLYGGAAAGVRAMTASSGPGISLMQEGFSYLAGAELPCVIADIMRGGPGLGNIAPEQGDYNQIVKGGGHGNYRTLVLAPDSVQEMADLTTLGLRPGRRVSQSGGGAGRRLHRADDGAGGVRRPRAVPAPPDVGRHGHRRDPPQPGQLHLTWSPTCWSGTSASWKPSISEAEREVVARRMLAHRRRRHRPGGLRHHGPRAEGGGGTGPRRGLRVGLLRPITLYPFPAAQIRELSRRAKAFAVVETEHRATGGRRAPGARGPRPGGVLQPRGRQCSVGRGGAGVPGAEVRNAVCGPRDGGGADPWLATR